MKADKDKVVRLLKTAKGQVEGIIKMVDEDRYCIDVSNQIMACQAILSKVNKVVLNAHLHNCVANCTDDSKMDEIMQVLDKLL